MHSSLPFKAPWIFVFILMSMQSLYGHDRRFAFSEQSTVLPAQASELEVWNTGAVQGFWSDPGLGEASGEKWDSDQ